MTRKFFTAAALVVAAALTTVGCAAPAQEQPQPATVNVEACFAALTTPNAGECFGATVPVTATDVEIWEQGAVTYTLDGETVNACVFNDENFCTMAGRHKPAQPQN